MDGGRLVGCCLLVLVVVCAVGLLGGGFVVLPRPTLENLPPGRVTLASSPFRSKFTEEFKLRESGFTYKIPFYVHFEIYVYVPHAPRAPLAPSSPAPQI